MAKLKVRRPSAGHYNYQKNWEYGPNSAGGVSAMISFLNLTGKTIKYACFWFVPINSVGDAVSCTISGQSEKGGKYTGPLAHDSMARGIYWENMWYNNSITQLRLTRCRLEYMDGTCEEVPLSEIEYDPLFGGGCYVATAVYGSYDCPEVWTLRRFRDDSLAKSPLGRAFVHTYYAISPTLVKWFGHTEWFKRMWRGTLDRMVADLQKKGFESTPYDDKEW